MGTAGNQNESMVPVQGAAVRRLAEVVTASAFLVLGTFTSTYRDLRLLGRVGLIRYPAIGW